MTSMSERYDRSAERYLRWWAPVLRPTALGVLETVAAEIVPATRLLDLGTGTGALAIEALGRWPSISVTGLDASGGMLAIAEREAARTLAPNVRERLELVTGLADRMPFGDATFDVVVSSFVLQLVPHRPRALAEVRRVLRPGGVFAFVTWQVADEPFAPDEAFYEALDELEIDDEEPAEEARSGDFISATSAAAQLRRAGFRRVETREETLRHAFHPRTYIDFLEQYAEEDTFLSLEPELARRLRERTLERLAKLEPASFVWRVPVVTGVARRGGDRS
jgi:ubiquinone/menaquinone biosynthesis C-methylase UbiE